MPAIQPGIAPLKLSLQRGHRFTGVRGQLQVGAYDAETLEEKWSMNVGTSFQAPPITFTADGKQYIAIAGGGIGIAGFGYEELANIQSANMLWVFGLE